MYDVVVVGAGPAGLQAAVAAASEGLDVVVLEKDRHVGGQIRHTPRFENSIFANGQSGSWVTDGWRQKAESFGVNFVQGEAYSLSPATAYNKAHSVRWATDTNDFERGTLWGHAVVLAMGMTWNPVAVPGMIFAKAAGLVSYGPGLATRARWQDSDHVAILGGGPAAGQAAVVLGERGIRVSLICRTKPKMPQYLSDRVDNLPNVVPFQGVSVEAIDGLFDRGHIGLLLDDGTSIDANHLMLCAGQRPATGWLKGTLPLDDADKIVIQNGQTCTNIPGVFAVGDCRAGSTARVGSAVGDGSMAVTEIWRHFKAAPDPKEGSCLLPA